MHFLRCKNLRPIPSLASGGWGSAPTPCLLFLYTVTTFYKHTLLALKHFLVVEREQIRLFLTSKSAVFTGGGTKILFASTVGYPSYATDTSALNIR